MSRDIAHVIVGHGRGWTVRTSREGRDYEGRGRTREEAREACDEALALDGWPPGPGPRQLPTPTPIGPQGPQLEPV